MKLEIFYLMFPLMLVMTSCDELKPSKPTRTSSSNPGDDLQAPPSLADITTLTDKLGRSLEVKVIGHNSEEIGFVRLSDNQSFTWKIDQLSPADQKIVRSIPPSDESLSMRHKVEAAPRVSTRQKDIDRLRKEIELLESKLPGLIQGTTNGVSPRAKGVERQIELKMKEMAELEAEIQKILSP